MVRRTARLVAKTSRGVAGAIRAKWKAFALVTLGVFVLSAFLPVIVLSLSRRAWDDFALHPALRELPRFLTSGDIRLQRKFAFLSNLVLFSFSAENRFGVEWAYAVDGRGLVRIVFTSLLFGMYFALWFYRRDQVGECGWGARGSRQGGVAGALMSVLGLSTGPCSVVGCGAPVMPVLGLAFTGLTSGTLQWLAWVPKVATPVILGAMTLGVGYLGWLVGGTAKAGNPPRTL